MNAEMYIPIYGNYMTMKHMVSEEESERDFKLRARDAISSGIISGALFGAGVNYLPGKASVTFVQALVETPVLPLAAPAALAVANFAAIESAPEEKQRGLYQMFSSALTGTFGGDYSGLV
jgi:hypothetical protein